MDGVTGAPVAATEQLADFALGLRHDAIPAEVARAAKLHLLDALGCGLAASALGIAGEGRALALADGGRPDASAIGADRLLPAAAAAFANGMLCHGLDFDDTHADSVCHVSAVVVPAALAAGEAAGASGRELLTAVIAGNEIVARLGMAASGAFHARGFHPTSVCGVFGATAAASRLGGLASSDAVSALGLAGSFASGLFAYLEDGTSTKPLHAGLAAQSGIRATRLASLGTEGPPSVLEARFGFFRAFADTDPALFAEQLADLGVRWETPRIAFKAYPACHYIHGALGAGTLLLAEHTPDATAIRDVEVTVPPGPAVALVLEPAAEKAAPRTEYEAKFSLPYSLAALLVHGRVGVDSYVADAIVDDRVLELAARVRYRVEDFDSAARAFPGGVRLSLADGSVLQARLEFQQGAPENPLDEAAVVSKFRANAELALDPDRVEALADTVLRLDELEDAAAALAALRQARSARTTEMAA
ncbi:MAG: MmgE/PrpD family protein [Actinomycetia bacterium]|nr:MmgE/PrpD family protein [Actinomycetes bacterium]